MLDQYNPQCHYSIRLLKKLKSLDINKVLDFKIIKKAIYWAKTYHAGQFRKSGEPFYTHPLEVAYMISEYNLKTHVIVTSILHDIIEDTEVTAGMILDNFGWRIAQMVNMLTRDQLDGTKLSVEEILNNAYKNGEKEVLLIKLIDRLHNLQTIGFKTYKKSQQTIKETIEEFIILALYLENTQLTQRLTELCFNKINITNVSQQYPKLLSDNSLILSQAFQNASIQIKIQNLLEL